MTSSTRLEEVFLFQEANRPEEAIVIDENRKSTPEQAVIPARYSRQILFDGIGMEGQARIIASRVALVGCGALGTVQASLLARAGVGTLRIIDRDFVEESNLQRQILFDEDDVRNLLPKAVAAEKKLRAVIDDYQLTVFANGRAIISGTYDLALAKSLYSRYVGA